MYCNNCGMQLEDETNFCSRCGKAIRQEFDPTNKIAARSNPLQQDKIEQDVARLRAAKKRALVQQDNIEREVVRLRAVKKDAVKTAMPQPSRSGYSDMCQSCGVLAPTRHIEFYQNVGVVVLRFHKSIKGNLCKSCISKYFWKFTLIDVLFGWWGVISFVVTPFFILNNVGRYIGSLEMPSNPSEVTRYTPAQRNINFIMLSMGGTIAWAILLVLDYLVRADSYYLNSQMNPVAGVIGSTTICLGGWFLVAAIIAFAIRK